MRNQRSYGPIPGPSSKGRPAVRSGHGPRKPVTARGREVMAAQPRKH